YILDSEGCFSFVGGAVERLLGFTKEELIGTHFTSIFQPEDVNKAKFRFNERRTGERSTKGFETRLITKEGKKADFEIDCLQIELHAFGIYDESIYGKDKKYLGTYGVARDITSHKQMEDELYASRAGLITAQRIAHLGNWDQDIVNNKLLWSDEIYRIFGLSPKEFENNFESFLNSVHPDDRQFVKKSVDHALNKKKPYKIDHRIILPTGEERIVHEQAEVEFNASGRAIRMIGTVQDITERKLSKEKLQKSQTMLQTVFDGISEPLIMLDRETKIQMLNDAARKYYGLLESKNYNGICCFTACNGLTKPCDGCDIPMIIKKHEMRSFEREGLMDSSRIEEITIFPLVKLGQDNGSLIRISDITKKRKIQEQLIRSDRLSSLGQLSGGIAHEIRNPLSSIKLFVDILGDTERFSRKTEEMEIIDDIRYNANKLEGIVRRVLDFAKPSVKSKAKMSINALIRDEIKLWSSKIRKLKIDVNLSLKKGLPPIWGDAVELRQVINNLVMNALDASEKGGALSISTSKKTSSFHKDRQVVVIKVKDTGSGIHPEDKKKIFDPFFTTKGDGTGLGLSISHQIIKRHGGIISCKSKPGEGATFTIELPFLSEE
ncbi:MAG: PAS domain-containing protein, partial [Actinobacteria bacterium]|nr:PAS domain-containing protein [Actinomycetota bacterium]